MKKLLFVTCTLIGLNLANAVENCQSINLKDEYNKLQEIGDMTEEQVELAQDIVRNTKVIQILTCVAQKNPISSEDKLFALTELEKVKQAELQKNRQLFKQNEKLLAEIYANQGTQDWIDYVTRNLFQLDEEKVQLENRYSNLFDQLESVPTI